MKVGDCAEPSLDDSPPEADRDHDAEGRVTRIPAPVEHAHHDAFKFWYICVVQPRRGGWVFAPIPTHVQFTNNRYFRSTPTKQD